MKNSTETRREAQAHKVLATTRIDGCEWVAYQRHRRVGAPIRVIKRKGERIGAGFWDTSKPPAAEEIAARIAEEQKLQEEIRANQAFMERPEREIAEAIRARIDSMSATNHPLDALTLAEWSDLHRKITGREVTR